MFAQEMNNGRVAVMSHGRIVRTFATMFAAIAFLASLPANAADKKPSAFRECQSQWSEKKDGNSVKYGYFFHMADCLKSKQS